MDLDLATAGRHLRTLSKLTSSETLKSLAAATSECCAGREYGPGDANMWCVSAAKCLPDVLWEVLERRKYFRLDKERVVQIGLEAPEDMLSIGPSSEWSPEIAARLRQAETLAEIQDQRRAESTSPTPVAALTVPVWTGAWLNVRTLARQLWQTTVRMMRALDPLSADQAQAG